MKLTSLVRNINKYSRIITQDKSQGASQAMFYALGLKESDLKKGQVGIGSNWYESNPCNNHLDILSRRVKKSINLTNNLIGFQFNTIGISDGQTNGHSGMNFSLPSRELIADSYESFVKAHLYDGNISIPGCDKNLPGCLMAMISINKPSFMIYGGSILPGCLNNKQIDIVDAFQSFGTFLQDNDEEKRKATIKNACPGSGSCGGMYTANTMATAIETMGMMLPYSSSNPALSPEKLLECEYSGDVIKRLMIDNTCPLDIITKESIENAITIMISLGGSTNGVLHLLAIAKTANIDLSYKDFERIGAKTKVIANLKPIGDYLMYDLYKIGGLPVILKILQEKGLLNDNCLTVTGRTLKQNLEDITYNIEDIKHIVNLEDTKDCHIRILYGNLSPNGCVAKISGKEGTYFRGQALVYESENEAINGLKSLNINQDNKKVIVIRNQGPKGGPGMPEMLKPTSTIVGMGLKDNVALITDGRFSGGSHGFIVGHISPESYNDGPIAYIKNGDYITIDINKGIINVDNLENYISNPTINPKLESNYLKKYVKLVSGSETGCITY
jgi:dihydroxy-acid dehydratase